MKLSTLMRWVGPAAIVGGVFMVFSELSGLPIHIPYLGQDPPTGYAAVGTGLVLFALVLLLVGMVGRTLRRPPRLPRRQGDRVRRRPRQVRPHRGRRPRGRDRRGASRRPNRSRGSSRAPRCAGALPGFLRESR